MTINHPGVTHGTQSFSISAGSATQPQPHASASSYLLPEYAHTVGPGGTIAVIDAWHHWGPDVNPFIPNSPNWEHYCSLQENYINTEKQKWEKVPILEDPEPAKRRFQHPVLRFEFDSLRDIKLRLSGTLIFIGQKLYYVASIYRIDDDYMLLLEDVAGKRWRVFYKQCRSLDLRCPEPQYFIHGDKPAFFTRPPFRQQQQGTGAQNTACKYVASQSWFHLQHNRYLMRGLNDECLIWDSKYADLMRARALHTLRLSKDIAFFTNGTHIYAEYRGRKLGAVHDDVVKLDELDFRKPWIRKDISMVGCSVRQA